MRHLSFTKQVLLGMISGILVGLILHPFHASDWMQTFISDGALHIIGTIFITLLKMLVVPVVLISIICGASNLADPKVMGRIGAKTILLYLGTTCIAISLALGFALLFNIGSGANLVAPSMDMPANPAPTFTGALLNLFTSNPIRSLNVVVMKLVDMVIALTPYGVFALIAKLVITTDIDKILYLFGYFFTVLLVLGIHVILTNSIIIGLLARLNPAPFFKKMLPVQLFAFSTASSNASIPVTLKTVENQLGVDNQVAGFTIPLGATINMDGTAIMQGVATVFIAHVYNIDLSLTQYLMVILTATLSSIGTAGIPSAGLITLTLVLTQVGLPVEGIALIIGIDRILDMVRTAVNVTGDAAITTYIAKTEQQLDFKTYP